MTPKFLFLHRYKTVPSVYNKTHQSGPLLPISEANMNYVPTSHPSSMKQCKKSVTVKLRMELLLTTTTRKQSRSGALPYMYMLTLMIARLQRLRRIENVFHVLEPFKGITFVVSGFK